MEKERKTKEKEKENRGRQGHPKGERARKNEVRSLTGDGEGETPVLEVR